MNTLSVIIVLVFVVGVVGIVAYALFQLSPFAHRVDRYRDPSTHRPTGESPRLD